MQDTMPKALDSDTESEIPASVQSNNNSEPNTDIDEKPEVDALCARLGKIEPGTLPPTTNGPTPTNGNCSDTDSSVSMASSARLTTTPSLVATGSGNLSDGPSSLPAPPPTLLPKVNPNATPPTTPTKDRGASGYGSGSGGTTSNPDRVKKYRHQHFSKNIYIGTKNAEKWDTLRNLLQFKNDVEFVSFLLRLAELDERKRKVARAAGNG